MPNVCGGCTLCCKVLDIEWMSSPRGEYCRHCEPEKGCQIHAERPEECRTFDCAWLQSDADEDLRPDKIGCVFERIDDDLMLGTVDEGELSKVFLAQAGAFQEQGFSLVVMGQGRQPLIQAKRGTTPADVWARFMEIVRERHGNA